MPTSGTHFLPLPANPLFAGLSLYAQGLRLEALPAGLTIELTNGIAAAIGY